MADDVFKLPQSSYETICRIVQAYAQVGDKTNLTTISKILGNDTTVISRNTQFLVSVGLLEGGRDKGVTAAGAKLGRALEFNEAEDIASGWREVLVGHTLVQRILSAIRIRGGMDAPTLQAQIVYTAGVNKTSGTMTGGGAVVEMLRAANLVLERDGRYIVPSAAEGPSHTEDESDAASTIETVPAAAVVQRVIETGPSGINVTIELRIDVKATPDQLSEVGRGVRQLLNELREHEHGDWADSEGPTIES